MSSTIRTRSRASATGGSPETHCPRNRSKCGTLRESRYNISGKEPGSPINPSHKSRCHKLIKWDRIDTPSTIDRCGAGRRESADALTKWTCQQRVRESGSIWGQKAEMRVDSVANAHGRESRRNEINEENRRRRSVDGLRVCGGAKRTPEAFASGVLR